MEPMRCGMSISHHRRVGAGGATALGRLCPRREDWVRERGRPHPRKALAAHTSSVPDVAGRGQAPPPPPPGPTSRFRARLPCGASRSAPEGAPPGWRRTRYKAGGIPAPRGAGLWQTMTMAREQTRPSPAPALRPFRRAFRRWSADLW
jgi:hypothetical protein